jgi:uncharacterized membrane protein
MLSLLGIAIILIFVAYIIKEAAGFLQVPPPITKLLLLLLAFVFVVYVLSTLGILPEQLRIKY